MRTNKLTKILSVATLALGASLAATAQGWPADYGGVMLQGFSWDSYSDTKWTNLQSMAADMDGYIDLLWIPNAGNCGNGNQMGYSPKYWFPTGSNYNSSFGTLAELRAMVNTMRSHNIGIIGDVVINHRQNQSNWTNFVSETYNGVTYSMTASDIVSDDDGGETANHLQSGEHLGNADTGTDWNGLRDLDHTSTNVQNNVKAYLNALLNDLGYVGFRYDMVLGYSPTYTKMYNTYAHPQFSVGECWEKDETIRNWIDDTKDNGTPTSAAFDFQFRYTIRNAVNGNDWRKLGQTNTGSGGYPLVSANNNSGNYRQWAITFVENHDTQDRGNVSGYSKDPIVRDTLAANAYMFAMPGTPCVFLPHWLDYKDEIKNMIAIRKMVGITNTSTVPSSTASATGYYVVRTTGSTGSVLRAAVGPGAASYSYTGSDKLIAEGYHYKYWVSMPNGSTLRTAWLNKPSGTYSGAIDVTAMKLTTGANNFKLVYTTDGSTPNANSTQIDDNGIIHVDHDMTVKIGLLANSNNQVLSASIQTREYKIVERKKITVYLKDPGWSSVRFYSYDFSDGTSNDSWPGVNVTNTTEINGDTFYYREYESDDQNFSFMVIFDNGSSGNDNQTVNIGPVTKDVYYEITGGGGNSKLTVTDITDDYAPAFTPEWELGIVGANNPNGWDPSQPLLFTPHADGTYTLTISGAVTGEFKLSHVPYGTAFAANSNDWATFNDGALYVANLTRGDNTLAHGEDNMMLPVAGDVTLTASNVTATGCTLNVAVDNEVIVTTAFYLRGTINGWSGNADAFTSQGNGVYTLTKTFSGEFKIVDENNTWWSTSSATTLTSDNNTVTLSAGGTGNNMRLDAESEYTLTVTVSGDTKTLTVTGFPQLPLAYNLFGAFNGWSAEVPFVENNGVFTLTQTLGGEGATGEFLIRDQYGHYLGGATNDNVYTLSIDNRSVTLATEEQGKKNLYIADEAEYTFTIQDGVLTVDGWTTGITLAQAIAGETGTITDDLIVVRVYDGKVYATDGENSWVRLDGVTNASSMTPGFVIDGYQISGAVTTPLLAPAIAVNGALTGNTGSNLPALRQIFLTNGYTIDGNVVLPTAGEVVNMMGYFFYQDGEPRLYAYSGTTGTGVMGMHLTLDGDADMEEGNLYAIDVAIALVEAWESGNGAPRRVAPSDDDYYTNLTGSVVGSPAIQTAVNDLDFNATVVSVKYVSLAGCVSDHPFDGVNIMVTTHADGTTTAIKVIR